MLLVVSRLPAAVQLMQAVGPVLQGVLCNAFPAACAALRSAPSAQVSAHAAACPHPQGRMGAYIEHSIAGAPWQSRFWIFTMQTSGCVGQMAEGATQWMLKSPSCLAWLPHADTYASSLHGRLLARRMVRVKPSAARAQSTQQSACVSTLAGRGAGHARVRIPDGMPSPLHHRLPHIL